MLRQSWPSLAVLLLLTTAARSDDWPQWMGRDRDGVWHETGILDRFPEKGPKELWRVKIAGGYSGPAVARGRVFVHDYLTDADTRKVSNPSARPRIQGKERVLCLDARSGKELWKHEYDCPYRISYPAGPRCTPTVDGDRVYTLGAEGDLLCLDAAKGTVFWSKSLKKEYKTESPIWGFAGHPLVDGKKLICVVGGEGSVAVAFDKETGKELWRSLSAKAPGYSPPTIIEAGGKRQLLIWHEEAINGLDPETGKVYWTVELAPQYGMSIMAPRKSGDFLYAGGIGGRGVLLKLEADRPAVKEVWRGKRNTAIYPINSTPVEDRGILYGMDEKGALMAVKVETGERLWESAAPTGGKKVNNGTAFVVKNGDRWFLFSETGHLILAKLTPEKYEEVGRVKLLEPTGISYPRDVVWSHPAFADKCVFARNDKEIVCVSLAAEQ